MEILLRSLRFMGSLFSFMLNNFPLIGEDVIQNFAYIGIGDKALMKGIFT